MIQLAPIGQHYQISRTFEFSPFPMIRAFLAQSDKLLENAGITNVQQLLKAGNTHNSRLALSVQTGIPHDVIEDLVKLADLCRISDIKGMRVRLLFDTGFDTIEKIAAQDPGKMRDQIIEVRQREKIAARHPTWIETKFWVEQAKKLPKLVEY